MYLRTVIAVNKNSRNIYHIISFDVYMILQTSNGLVLCAWDEVLAIKVKFNTTIFTSRLNDLIIWIYHFRNTCLNEKKKPSTCSVREKLIRDTTLENGLLFHYIGVCRVGKNVWKFPSAKKNVVDRWSLIIIT